MFDAKSKHSYVDLFEGMLIGGALSAATVLLFGTKKGKELQKELMHKYKQICQKTEGMRKQFGKLVKKTKAKKIKRIAKSIKRTKRRS